MPDRQVAADEVATWISAFLAERSGASAPEPDSDLFTGGVLDSLGVVTLIVAAEGRFDVRLTEDDLQDPRFATVRGLAAIVSEASERAAA